MLGYVDEIGVFDGFLVHCWINWYCGDEMVGRLLMEVHPHFARVGQTLTLKDFYMFY